MHAGADRFQCSARLEPEYTAIGGEMPIGFWRFEDGLTGKLTLDQARAWRGPPRML
jgi:hypothetical protein